MKQQGYGRRTRIAVALGSYLAVAFYLLLGASTDGLIRVICFGASGVMAVLALLTTALVFTIAKQDSSPE